MQHRVGHIPQNTEVGVPLTYTDYYFIEAMGDTGILSNLPGQLTYEKTDRIRISHRL